MTGYLYRGRPGLEELNARIMADRAANPGGTGPPFARPEHGTEAGARRHWRAGEEACGPCRAAAAYAALMRNQDRRARKRRQKTPA